MIYSPKHNYKLPYKNSRDKGLWLTHPFMGWLASGVKDYKGVEIYEGDLLADCDQELFEVVFVDGKFMANPYSYHGWLPLDEIADTLEINGHIAEEGNNHVDC